LKKSDAVDFPEPMPPVIPNLYIKKIKK
jgi:hypothetical protein